MGIEITEETKELLKKCRENQLMRCAIYGHDYRSIPGIEGGPICVCCAARILKKN
jgi:hypothetical protein